MATSSCCSCAILRCRAVFSFCDIDRMLALALRASRWSFSRCAERLRVTESSDRLRRSSVSFSVRTSAVSASMSRSLRSRSEATSRRAVILRATSVKSREEKI